MKTAIFAFSLGLLAAACASPYASPTRIDSGRLTTPDGMTLYVFDKDVAGAGRSACSGECAGRWPPLIAAAHAVGGGDYSVIPRDDGARQWAYKGKPLYRWFKDQRPGDTSGDGVNNVWHVARP